MKLAYSADQPMANYGTPQIEDGYTRIANELLDAIISHPFSRREYAVVMAVIRVTYGFNKKEDAVSGWQLSEMTGIDRSHVSKTLSELVQKNILIKSYRCRISHGQNIPFIAINKHYKTWLTVAETATVVTVANSATVAETAPVPKQPQTVAELATRPLPKQPTHKDIPKDIPKDICEAKQILEYLNTKAQKNYRPTTANLDLIRARLKEGFTQADCLRVIDMKTAEWIYDTAMNKFLRPATLFGASKFSQYSGEMPAISKPLQKRPMKDYL